MTQNLLSILMGLIGGLVPGGLRFAWTLRRGNKTDAGTIDLSAYKAKP